MMKLLIIALVMMWAEYSVAQNITVNEPLGVQRMMSLYESVNRSRTEIPAWRIQVLATTDRRMMEQTKARFSRYFPYLRTRWTHNEPYYQIKAGAFSSKIEALPELEKVKRHFSKAHLVVDQIPYSELMD